MHHNKVRNAHLHGMFQHLNIVYKIMKKKNYNGHNHFKKKNLLIDHFKC